MSVSVAGVPGGRVRVGDLQVGDRVVSGYAQYTVARFGPTSPGRPEVAVVAESGMVVVYPFADWTVEAVRESRPVTVDADTLIAGCRHADWCCTKGCAQPGGVHYVGDENAVPMPDAPLVDRVDVWAPCPGSCTCEVAVVVHQVVQQLTGGSE